MDKNVNMHTFFSLEVFKWAALSPGICGGQIVHKWCILIMELLLGKKPEEFQDYKCGDYRFMQNEKLFSAQLRGAKSQIFLVPSP